MQEGERRRKIVAIGRRPVASSVDRAGRGDDTAALQAAFDKVGGTGGTVLVPDGTYMVDAGSNERRLKIRKDTTLKLSPGATFKAIPNGALNYSLLTIANVANVTVSGGTLEGDRAQHTDKAGEWGMGLMIMEGAKNVTVSGVTSKEMWGEWFLRRHRTERHLLFGRLRPQPLAGAVGDRGRPARGRQLRLQQHARYII